VAVVAAYPGSFDPPTSAHVTLAEAAVHQGGIAKVDFVLSRQALGKEGRSGPTAEQRMRVLRAVASSRPWLGVVVVDARLVADIAAGYDAVVMGADKWEQVLDPVWYGGSAAARDDAVRRLPRLLVAPRAGRHPASIAAEAGLTVAVTALDVPAHLADVSSTRARSGDHHLMLPEAVSSGLWT
jgi:hypothetical protein